MSTLPTLSFDDYRRLWVESVENPDDFFRARALESLAWTRSFTRVTCTALAPHRAETAWFDDGEINACFNCVDRHALATPDRLAIIFEPEGPLPAVHISYSDLFVRVCRLANALLALGVCRGEIVAIYLPMIPEAAVAMLACARIGAVHSVVFSGFSSAALQGRLADSKCRVLITADCYSRAGQYHDLISRGRVACHGVTTMEHLVVVKNSHVYTIPNAEAVAASINVATRAPSPTLLAEHNYGEICANVRGFCPPAQTTAEDPLFVLYTSGSTGKPKGLVHTTAGYLFGALMTTANSFAVGNDGTPNVLASTADFGWITGHTYGLYGPLVLGATTVLFGAPPTFNGKDGKDDDVWTILARNRATVFYTAPTVLRVLRARADQEARLAKHMPTLRTHLRVLGSVGESIDPDTWNWLHDTVGGGVAAVVDTYWQTETGSHVIAPMPFVTPVKPGSATFPVFGLRPVLVDAHNGAELPENVKGVGVLCFRGAWPSMARTILNDHARYAKTYFPLEDKTLFWTGDTAERDAEGYIYIRGRVDDVLNVSGHRLSTAEIEAALVALETVIEEAAVVGRSDDFTGHRVTVFVTVREGSPQLPPEIVHLVRLRVRDAIGAIAVPRDVVIVRALPKTRSGKIMRRVLRKIADGEQETLGDLSTLEDKTIIEHLVSSFMKAIAAPL